MRPVPLRFPDSKPARASRQSGLVGKDESSSTDRAERTGSSYKAAIMKSFDSLTEREVLALAISNEEDDARIYESFAEGLRESLSRNRQDIRADEGRRGRAPPSADRPLQGKVRRAHPAHPPGRRRAGSSVGSRYGSFGRWG